MLKIHKQPLPVILLEWAQWLEEVFKGKDFGLTIVSHTEPADINIYARPDYYFQYDSAAFQGLMADLNNATDPAKRSEILKAAQKMIADEYVNGYLFQLAALSVANAKVAALEDIGAREFLVLGLLALGLARLALGGHIGLQQLFHLGRQVATVSARLLHQRFADGRSRVGATVGAAPAGIGVCAFCVVASADGAR